MPPPRFDQFGEKVIVIPRVKSKNKYFEPHFVMVLPGQRVTWINRDTASHALISGEAGSSSGRNHISSYALNTGIILAGESHTVTIQSAIGNIPYFCSLHPDERGTIIVNSKEEHSLSKAERLELLDSIFTFRSASARYAVRSKSKRHFHPDTLLTIADPDLVKIHYKILTVVFWDLSGFSALCENLKEHVVLVVEFLKEYYAKATEIIHKHDGVLDKFIGDGIMALFGFQGEDNDATRYAINAVNAALELKESFESIRIVWDDIWRNKVNDENRIPISLKCGMNTGYSIVGSIPTKEREEFTAIGSSVNLASRLESRATANQIIVSSHTRERIHNQFDIEPISVKVGEEIKAFEYEREYYEVLGRII